jgi:hypothetical protein
MRSLKEMNRWTIYAVCLVAIIAVLTVVYWMRSSTGDGAVTPAAILNSIPVGSSVDFAKSTMEADGYHCHMEYNKRYTADDPAGGRRQVEYPAADFLFCDSGESFPKRSQVIFIVRDETVDSVAVGVRLI